MCLGALIDLGGRLLDWVMIDWLIDGASIGAPLCHLSAVHAPNLDAHIAEAHAPANRASGPPHWFCTGSNKLLIVVCPPSAWH